METERIDAIIKIIAERHHTTAEQVRKEMLLAMTDAQQSSDPVVRERWAQIPRKGEVPTIEEFVSYMARLQKPTQR